MVGRNMVAAVTAAAVACTACAGNLHHTMQPHPAARENWAAVMRLPIGTYVRVEDHSGAWTVGGLVAKESQGIIVGESARKPIPRSQILRVWILHVHGDWTGIKDVAVGAVVGGLIGRYAVPKHPKIAATLLAAAGGFTGLVVGVITILAHLNDPPKDDEVLVYYSDRVAAPG